MNNPPRYISAVFAYPQSSVRNAIGAPSKVRYTRGMSLTSPSSTTRRIWCIPYGEMLRDVHDRMRSFSGSRLNLRTSPVVGQVCPRSRDLTRHLGSENEFLGAAGRLFLLTPRFKRPVCAFLPARILTNGTYPCCSLRSAPYSSPLSVPAWRPSSWV
jgi:hypothetical protein